MSAPFRIVRGVRRGPGDEFKAYLERLLKMIPGEVVGLYLIGNGFIPADKATVSAIWAGFCLLVVLIVRKYGTSDGPDKPWQKFPVLVSMVAFAIWVYSLGGPFVKFNLYIPYLGSLLVLAWSFLIPIFYEGPKEKPAD
jgi:hypothetical protein